MEHEWSNNLKNGFSTTILHPSKKIERNRTPRATAMAGRGDLLVFLALAAVSSSLLLPKAHCNSEGDALHSLRRSLTDPDNVLQSWDPNLVNPCTWFHITCNQDNRVTRLYLSIHLSLSFHQIKCLYHFLLYFRLFLLRVYWISSSVLIASSFTEYWRKLLRFYLIHALLTQFLILGFVIEEP